MLPLFRSIMNNEHVNEILSKVLPNEIIFDRFNNIFRIEPYISINLEYKIWDTWQRTVPKPEEILCPIGLHSPEILGHFLLERFLCSGFDITVAVHRTCNTRSATRLVFSSPSCGLRFPASTVGTLLGFNPNKLYTGTKLGILDRKQYYYP